MMKKRILAAMLTTALLLSACQGGSPAAGTAAQSQDTAQDSKTQDNKAQNNKTQDNKAQDNNSHGSKPQDSGGPDSSQISASAWAEWTVLIYLCGTDLETYSGMGSGNLQSLAQVPYSDQVNFVIQTGGTREWQDYDIDTDVLTRLTMAGGELAEVETLPLANMGDPNTLGSFLSWGVQNYPARRYMALLWDHGGGPLTGAINDELYDSSCMTVPELAKAVSMAGASFEVIGFDACLMGSLEIANALSPYSRYLVASEEVEPGQGWDFNGFGSYLVENPACDGAQLGKQICDTYIALNTNTEEDVANLLTLSVIDLSKLEPLNRAFGDMALEMGGMIPDVRSCRKLAREISGVERYYEGAYTIDLGDMAQKASSLNPGTTQKVTEALDDAVVYATNGDTRVYSNGLSVMYGMNLPPSQYNTYASVCPVPEYLAYLDAMNYLWRAPDWVYEKVDPLPEPVWKDYHVDFGLDVSDDGQGELYITEGKDAVTEVTYKLYRFDTKEDRIYCMGDGKDISGDFETGIFQEEFDGFWPGIDGAYCFPHEIEYQKEYTLYNIPVSVEGTLLFLRAAYFPDPDGGDGHYQLYGLWAPSDFASGIPSRNPYPLVDGMEITFLFPEINSELSSKLEYHEGNTIIYDSASTRMEDIPIKDGQYGLMFEIEDVMGRKHSSEMLSMTCADGSLIYEIPEDGTEGS